MLPVRSQIFEYLSETFHNDALEELQSARSEKKKNLPAETPDYFDLLKACGRWGHVFVTSASPTVGPEQKTGYAILFPCSWWLIRY